MTKQPSYRFVGFEDEWKEVKLGEVYSFSQGQQVPVEEQFEQINENRIRFIRIVDLTNKGEEMRYIEFKSSTGRVYEKDIFFVRYGAVGVVGIGYDGIIANNLFKLNPQMSVDNKFMYVQFNREKFKKTLQGFSASTTMPAISFTDIRTIDIYLPSLPEQTAIGSFFQDIDQLISLQQRKLEVLKEQKKTYLKLLFPAKGQTKPALRFAGFEDDWKEVKVSDIFRVTRGQVLATTEISEEKTDTYKYPVYSSQTKNEGLLGYYDKYLFETAITWTTDGANAGTVNYREGKFYSTNVNGVLLSDEGFANKVIAEILNNEAWKYVSKVGNPKLMNNVMSEISLVIPNDFREISTLSIFFQDLDKAIAKQEEKVNQLKESKQTLLRKMFI